ncbi:hypothetical protein SH1V18_04370 [Vallitalea longa]|uniref:Uncharacterized protein n=1 Tax=Vallitalea longa TaxID=2936439 RepID=A0A9W5Y7K9_9FIRM|nr:sugar ABC transporter substrate-binding protein [Vallitalea longa]GKX27957.1 hypothetical protein SH1V18_04370 [Vallitalea longa]
MKRIIIKKIMACLLLVFLIVSAAGCSSKEVANNNNDKDSKKEPITITFPAFQVGVNSGAPVLKENIRLFNEKYGDEIKVIVEEIPGDQAYVDKMKILLSADDLPDLVYAGGYNLLDLAADNVELVDLTPYFEEDPKWKACFSEADLQFNSRNGKYYGIPEEKQPVGYFYNKELFAKAGLEGPANTWDEFFNQCETLKAAGITPLSMDTADSGWVSGLWLGSIVGTNGEVGNEFMNTYNVKDYDTEEFLEGITKLQKMFKEYTTVDAIGGKYENAANNFLSGKTAMMANGPWMIPDFSNPEKAPEGFAEKIGVAIYPDAGMYDAPMFGYFVASKDKEHADATVKLLKFLTNEEAQLRALNMIGRIPPSPQLELDEDTKENKPLLAKLIDLSHDAKYIYPNIQSAWYPNVVDRLSTDYPGLGMGDITPQEFIDRLNESANKNE